MALREFTDDGGHNWQVCDVSPAYVERRGGVDRRRQPRADAAERRRLRQHRMVVAPRFRFGWLVFESAEERRRLGPIPPGWAVWPESELRSLLRDAETLRTTSGPRSQN